MTILEAIRTYFLDCPLLEDGCFNVDYLGSDAGYSIDSTPCDPIIKKYVDGGAQKQFMFLFRSREAWGNDTINNIENNGFYEQLSDWIESNNEKGCFPVLEGKKSPSKMEVLTSGYLMVVTEDTAIYQIQLRLIYYEF